MNTISGENDQAPSVSGMRELFERWLISVGQDERQASRDYSAHDLFVAGALAMLTAEQREAFKAEQQRVNFGASVPRIRAIRPQYPHYSPEKALSNMLENMGLSFIPSEQEQQDIKDKIDFNSASKMDGLKGYHASLIIADDAEEGK